MNAQRAKIERQRRGGKIVYESMRENLHVLQGITFMSNDDDDDFFMPHQKAHRHKRLLWW